MKYAVYEVTEGHSYRNHQAGDTFEAPLNRNREQRFVLRGVLRQLGETVPSLAPGSFTFPKGWLSTVGKE